MRKYSFLLLLFLAPVIAHAGAFDLLDDGLKSASSNVTATIQSTAIIWLSSFVLIQTVITNLGLLKSGADIEAIYGKLMGSLLWFGFCFYVLKNGPTFIDDVSKGFFKIASDLAGTGGFDAGDIITKGADLAATLIARINRESSITNLFAPALLGGIMGVVILATVALIAFKVFLIKIETMLIIMIAPLSFAFMGLNSLKDQGIAPFKSLISLIYRVLVLAVILKTMNVMSANLVTVIELITSDSIDGIWSTVFAAVTGFSLLAFLVFKSDSIAANLASGSTSLGSGDVAAAAAAGAAVGAAVASGGASALGAAGGGAGKAQELMSDVMSKMSGGGSLSNASTKGSGGVGELLRPPSAPSSSVAGGANGLSAPKYETTSSGAPKRPEGPTEQSAPGASDQANSPSNESPAGSPAAPAPVAAADPEAQTTSQQTEPPATQGDGVQAAVIGGGQDNLARAVTAANNQVAPKKSMLDYLATSNQHFAQEKAATHVSISTHHSD